MSDGTKDDLKGRYQYVLDSMAELGSITGEERDTALKRLPKFPKIATQSQFGGQKGHMLALVKQELLTRGIATEEEIDGGGLRITTTFDPQVMADIEEAVLEQRPDAGMPGPAGNKDLHVGAATVDTRTGELLGFYGGQDYLDSQINWAVGSGLGAVVAHAARTLDVRLNTAVVEIDWSGSLMQLLEEHANRPRMSAASVSAVMLPDDVVERHGLRDFGPALLITETCFNAAGTPVNYAIDYHRGSHFSFSLTRK